MCCMRDLANHAGDNADRRKGAGSKCQQAECLLTSVCRQASEARAALDSATQARQALEAALKLLQRGEDAGPEEAAAVEAAIQEAQAQGTLLAEDVDRGNEVLQKWRQAAASKAKLQEALASKCLPAQLARAIQVACCSVRVEFQSSALEILRRGRLERLCWKMPLVNMP